MPELEFRDGKRNVAQYIADMMIGIETYKLTYEQAIEIANKKLLSDQLSQVQAEILRDHFREVKF